MPLCFVIHAPPDKGSIPHISIKSLSHSRQLFFACIFLTRNGIVQIFYILPLSAPVFWESYDRRRFFHSPSPPLWPLLIPTGSPLSFHSIPIQFPAINRCYIEDPQYRYSLPSSSSNRLGSQKGKEPSTFSKARLPDPWFCKNHQASLHTGSTVIK